MDKSFTVSVYMGGRVKLWWDWRKMMKGILGRWNRIGKKQETEIMGL